MKVSNNIKIYNFPLNINRMHKNATKNLKNTNTFNDKKYEICM